MLRQHKRRSFFMYFFSGSVVFSFCLVMVLAFPLKAGALSGAAGAQPLERTALPAGADWRQLARMNTDSPEADKQRLEQARLMFDAEVRPALLRAGIGEPDEFSPEAAASGQRAFHPGDMPRNRTDAIAGLIWLFHAFPEVQDRLLTGVLDRQRSTADRRKALAGELEVLLTCLACLEQKKVIHQAELKDAGRIMSTWRADASLAAPPDPSRPATDPKTRDFSARWLPLLPNVSGGDSAAVLSGLLIKLWDMRDNAQAMSALDSVLRDTSTEARERLRLLASTLLAFEVAARDAGKAAEVEVMDAQDAEPRQPEAAQDVDLPADGDPFLNQAARSLLETERLDPARETGTGVSMRELAAPPVRIWKGAAPGADQTREPLFMLFTSNSAVPSFFHLNSSSPMIPVFEQPVFSRKEPDLPQFEPGILALDPQKSEDAKLLDWYAEKGAIQGRSLLFSSRKQLAELPSLFASWFLLLRDEGKSPQPAVTFSLSGNYLHWLLPHLKGRAASLLMAPVERLWFARLSRVGSLWYEARAEGALPALSEKSPRPALFLNSALMAELRKIRRTEQRLRLVFMLRETYPKTPLTVRQGVEFIARLNWELDSVLQGAKLPSRDRAQLLEVLWMAHGSPEEKNVRAMVLSPAISEKDIGVLVSQAKKKLIGASGSEKTEPKGQAHE